MKQQCLLLGVSVVIPLLVAYFGFSVLLGILGVLSYLCFVVYQLYLSRTTPDKGHHEDLEAGD